VLRNGGTLSRYVTDCKWLTVGEIVKRADFASLGTNDRTQFMLADRRNALELIEDYRCGTRQSCA
jgi:phosphoenolpyruvate-protein kinase (PTS system EI component)